MGYIDTFYRQTLTEDLPFPALRESVECDTCIVGGGLAGLTVALQLARSGQSVSVLEAQRIASAAPIHGIMSVSRHENGDELRAQAEQLQREFDYSVEYMQPDEVRSALRSNRYFQALRDPRAFHMHPLNYLRAIAREIERLGGKVFESSSAISADLSGPEKTLRTVNGQVKARHVVIATGGYTTELVPQLKRAYLPIATYVMLSEEQPDLIANAITTTDAVLDSRRAGDYYRVVDGGKRLLWGGRITTRVASPAALATQLRREMTNTYPQLADLGIETSWSGLMSYARHLMPQIGRLQAGVWYCTAFGGHGLNTTAIGGKVIAEAILGQSDRYMLFAPFGLVWAGGLAGLSVAQLTYWKLQTQDWWRERSSYQQH